MESILFLPFIIAIVVFGGATAWLATEKGYDGGAAFLIGALLGPIGLAVYIGAPDRILRSIVSLAGTGKTLPESAGGPSESDDGFQKETN